MNKESINGFEYHLEKIWRSILGISQDIIYYWSSNSRTILEESYNIYTDYLEHFPTVSSLKRFIKLLKQPAAKNIIYKGIIDIWSLLDRIERLKIDNSLLIDLSYLLERIWRENRFELKQNKDAFDSFLKILNQLVEKQHYLALELLDQVRDSL